MCLLYSRLHRHYDIPAVDSTSEANRILFQNWSRPWKLIAMSLATSVSFTQGFGPLALAPMFPNLMESFDTDLAAVVEFTGVCILVLGFSNFFW